eukprot:scaffold31191_cov41-Attheya_sp.AAC.4
MIGGATGALEIVESQWICGATSGGLYRTIQVSYPTGTSFGSQATILESKGEKGVASHSTFHLGTG